MKTFRKILLLTILLLSFTGLSAQDVKLPAGLSISNHLEYGYDVEKEQEILENWLNLDYRYGIFSTGIRYEVFQPNDPNTSVNRGKERYSDIAYKYLRVALGKKKQKLNITVGNFYALFGRGMILKSYEDRNVRIDNNLLGAKVDAVYGDLKLTALSGMPENILAERDNIIHAVDLEYRLLKQYRFGGTFALNRSTNTNASTTRMAALRVNPSFEYFDIYAEYGVKFNDDDRTRIFNDDKLFTGDAIYTNLNLYYGGFGASLEYKKYDNYRFSTSDNSVNYNNPPSLKRDHTFILLNRHTSELDPNNEEGVQAELNYKFSDNFELKANYMYTRYLGADSYYYFNRSTANVEKDKYQEVFAQAEYQVSDKLNLIGAYSFQEEYVTFTKSQTPIIEAKYYLDSKNTIKFGFEHQWVSDLDTDEKYYDDILVLELLHSPAFTFSIVTEVQTKEPEPDNVIRKVWSFAQIGYTFWNHTDVKLLFGTRQEGNICIGGVCRYEPEFRGVELKMQTRLF